MDGFVTGEKPESPRDQNNKNTCVGWGIGGREAQTQGCLVFLRKVVKVAPKRGSFQPLAPPSGFHLMILWHYLMAEVTSLGRKDKPYTEVESLWKLDLPGNPPLRKSRIRVSYL